MPASSPAPRCTGAGVQRGSGTGLRPQSQTRASWPRPGPRTLCCTRRPGCGGRAGGTGSGSHPPDPLGPRQSGSPPARPSTPRPRLSLGRRCEICDDGFFGDPLGLSGDPQPCRRCHCSGNVDPNAVGNCDPLSGHCLRCLHNTTGAHCERCGRGFYGSALAPRAADKCTGECAAGPSRCSAGRGGVAASSTSVSCPGH